MQSSEVFVHSFSYGGAIGRGRDIPHQNSILLWFCCERIRLVLCSEQHHMLVGFPENIQCGYGHPVSSNCVGPQTIALILYLVKYTSFFPFNSSRSIPFVFLCLAHFKIITCTFPIAILSKSLNVAVEFSLLCSSKFLSVPEIGINTGTQKNAV